MSRLDDLLEVAKSDDAAWSASRYASVLARTQRAHKARIARARLVRRASLIIVAAASVAVVSLRGLSTPTASATTQLELAPDPRTEPAPLAEVLDDAGYSRD